MPEVRVTAPSFSYDFFDLSKDNPFFRCKLTCDQFEISPMINDYFDYQTSAHPVSKSIISLLNSLNFLLVSLSDDVFATMQNEKIAEHFRKLESLIYTELKQLSQYHKKEDQRILVQCIQYTLLSVIKRINILNQTHPDKIKSLWDRSALKQICIEYELIPNDS